MARYHFLKNNQELIKKARMILYPQENMFIKIFWTVANFKMGVIKKSKIISSIVETKSSKEIMITNYYYKINHSK